VLLAATGELRRNHSSAGHELRCSPETAQVPAPATIVTALTKPMPRKAWSARMSWTWVLVSAHSQTRERFPFPGWASPSIGSAWVGLTTIALQTSKMSLTTTYFGH
jgi:hypothetical protein